jgi:hypothetical protein
MRRPKPPLFLERESYRRRRLADAARVLPFVGTGLFLLPVVWEPQATPEADTVPGLLYLFGAWAALIVAALLLSRRLGAEPRPGEPEGRPPGDR